MFPTQWQTQALAVAVLLLLGCVGSVAGFVSGVAHGRQQVLVAWQQQRIADLDAGQREAIAARAELETATRRWEQERQEWNTRVAASAARGRALADRVRGSRGETGTGFLCDSRATPVADGSTPVQSHSPGTGTGDTAAVDAALANHLAACSADAEQLTALQDWIKKALH
ncbi:hypothetical protein UFOVP605_47 [uncultured Caudovirales phage]|uniref:Uncharacterized protein n=1 Tax=uncultured Caudovirales phage TaxID=2100421 RepID=A0A6J5NCM8_9CAUD|nr:hypothetical protein UFOVP605_47 [uncultured Caudovirales phage]